MSNKLQLLKKKLLSNRPAAASSEQRFDHFSNAPSNQMSSPQLQSKENVNSKSCENQQQIGQSKAEENIRGQTQSPEISSPTYQKQSKSAENIQISAKAVIEEKKEPWPKAVPQAQDIQEGEIKKTQQIVLKHKDEPALNLDYVERYPNLSCSVDDEVKAPVTLSAFDGIQKPEALQKESKQQQKKQKIVLKELEFVKESIRNLRSAVKGLQLLQKMAAQNPAIKGKIKGFLKEINIENLC